MYSEVRLKFVGTTHKRKPALPIGGRVLIMGRTIPVTWTGICGNAHPETYVWHRFIQHSGRLYASSISLAELYVWAFRRGETSSVLTAVKKLFDYEVSVVNFDEDSAEEFGRVRARLQKQGIEVNTVDLMIAVSALFQSR